MTDTVKLSTAMLMELRFLEFGWGSRGDWLHVTATPSTRALIKRGLVETRVTSRNGVRVKYYYEYRITEAGQQLLAAIDAQIDAVLADLKKKGAT